MLGHLILLFLQVAHSFNFPSEVYWLDRLGADDIIDIDMAVATRTFLEIILMTVSTSDIMAQRF